MFRSREDQREAAKWRVPLLKRDQICIGTTFPVYDGDGLRLDISPDNPIPMRDIALALQRNYERRDDLHGARKGRGGIHPTANAYVARGSGTMSARGAAAVENIAKTRKRGPAEPPPLSGLEGAGVAALVANVEERIEKRRQRLAELNRLRVAKPRGVAWDPETESFGDEQDDPVAPPPTPVRASVPRVHSSACACGSVELRTARPGLIICMTCGKRQ